SRHLAALADPRRLRASGCHDYSRGRCAAVVGLGGLEDDRRVIRARHAESPFRRAPSCRWGRLRWRPISAASELPTRESRVGSLGLGWLLDARARKVGRTPRLLVDHTRAVAVFPPPRGRGG